jgi:hypothetical protein
MSINNSKTNNRGFVLGMAMIVLAVLLTLSISITIILIRELKESSISYDTKVASSLADSAMLCAESIFKNFKNTNPTPDRSLFPVTVLNSPTVHFNSGDFAYVDPATVGCFDVPIFQANLIVAGSAPATGTVSTSDYRATTTVTMSNVQAYDRGAKVFTQIKRSDFPRFACAEIEMHTTSTGAVLIIGRGKVPCDSTSRVERVVVKRYN